MNSSFYPDSFSAFKKDLKKAEFQVITSEEASILFEEYKRTWSYEKLNEFIMHHAKYVLSYCLKNVSEHQKKTLNWDIMDLIQEWMVGMLIAAERYDTDKSQFLTYATYRIKVKINNFISTVWNASWLNSKDYTNSTAKAFYLFNDAQKKIGENLTMEDIAQTLWIKASTLQEKISAHSYNIIQLDSPVKKDDDSLSRGEVLQLNDKKEGSIDKELYNIVLQEMRYNLSIREYNIIKMYYLEHHTLEEISEKFDLTRERIRQIEETALWKILVAIGEKYEDVNIDLESKRILRSKEKRNKAEAVRQIAKEIIRKKAKKQRNWTQEQKAEYVLEQTKLAKINQLNLSIDEMDAICDRCISWNQQSNYTIGLKKIFDIAHYDPRISFIGTPRENIWFYDIDDGKEFFLRYLKQKSKLTSVLWIYDFIVNYYTSDDKNQLMHSLGFDNIDAFIEKKEEALRYIISIPWINS